MGIADRRRLYTGAVPVTREQRVSLVEIASAYYAVSKDPAAIAIALMCWAWELGSRGVHCTHGAARSQVVSDHRRR